MKLSKAQREVLERITPTGYEVRSRIVGAHRIYEIPALRGALYSKISSSTFAALLKRRLVQRSDRKRDWYWYTITEAGRKALDDNE